jgi:hypothetical protein
VKKETSMFFRVTQKANAGLPVTPLHLASLHFAPVTSAEKPRIQFVSSYDQHISFSQYSFAVLILCTARYALAHASAQMPRARMIKSCRIVGSLPSDLRLDLHFRSTTDVA